MKNWVIWRLGVYHFDVSFWQRWLRLWLLLLAKKSPSWLLFSYILVQKMLFTGLNQLFLMNAFLVLIEKVMFGFWHYYGGGCLIDRQDYFSSSWLRLRLLTIGYAWIASLQLFRPTTNRITSCNLKQSSLLTRVEIDIEVLGCWPFLIAAV